MSEIAAPKHAADGDGLWLTNGMRTLYAGPEPAFAYLTENPPRFRLRTLDETYAALKAAGHTATISKKRKYSRSLLVTDPAGNEIAFVGA